MNRRDFLTSCAAAGLLAPFANAQAGETQERRRRYHVCLSPEALEREPDLLETVAAAGVNEVWLAGYFYGHWPWPVEKLVVLRKRAESLGLLAKIVTVPLGHPGDALGSSDGAFPLTPPKHWQMGVRPDGSRYSGTSLHAPATEENVAAVRALAKGGFDTVFLDDDFRLATGPGVIGGCFCDVHRAQFLETHGYGQPQWEELLQNVK